MIAWVALFAWFTRVASIARSHASATSTISPVTAAVVVIAVAIVAVKALVVSWRTGGVFAASIGRRDFCGGRRK